MAAFQGTAALARFLTFLLIGPLIGTLVFVIAIAAIDLQQSPGRLPAILTDILPMAALGYTFGIVPAALGGIGSVLHALRRPSRRAQLLAALPMGAVAAEAGMLLIIVLLGAANMLDPMFYGVTAVAGAISQLGCTALFLRLVGPRVLAVR